MNKLNGTVADVLNQSGTSNGNDWKRTTVVVETNAKYNNLVPISFFNSEFNVKKGDQVEVEYFVGGREYKGKYFPQLDGNKLDVVGAAATEPPAAPEPPVVEEDADDDLPF